MIKYGKKIEAVLNRQLATGRLLAVAHEQVSAYKRHVATAPVCGQVRQLDGDARHAQPKSVHKAVNARDHGPSKKCGGHELRLNMK